MTSRFDHVALQVASLDGVAQRFRSLGIHVGETQEFAEEGTREVYVGADGCAGRLLLIEPIGVGPYARSMAKRGPGLHHVAIATSDEVRFVSSLAGTGWLLHVRSLSSMREFHNAWLARPGVASLVEVFRSDCGAAEAMSEFVSMVEIPVSQGSEALFDSLGIGAIRSSLDQEAWLTFDGKRYSCDELCI